MIKTYKYDESVQLSPHFNSKEFRCKCGEKHDYKVSEELVQKLEELYAFMNCSKIIISSGYRCVKHDKNVGGSGTGQHTVGTAADMCCYDKSGNPIHTSKVCCVAQDLGFKGIANINAAHQYIHLDMRTGNKWYGDETKGYNTVTDDFYKYYNITKTSTDAESTEKQPATAKRGIDVSAHNGIIDWRKAKASGVEFAILRAGYGRELSQKDTRFEDNYSGAKAAGVPVGAYGYSYAMDEDEARLEADVFMKVIKDKQFEYPVYFDIEESKQLALGKERVSAIITAFLDRVEQNKYWVGLYMSASPLTDCTTNEVKNRFAVWVANVGVAKPSYNGTYGMWQYSWKGNIDGINGDVDEDYCYVNYPEQIKARGLNGFGVSNQHVPEVQEPVIKEPTETVKPSADTDSDLDIEVAIGGVKYKGKVKKV